jgi:RHS repeat-associated protein
MKRSSFWLMPALALGLISPASANNPFKAECKKGCSSCGSGQSSGDTTCQPDADTNGVKITATSSTSQADAEQKCKQALANTTSPSGQAATPASHGVTPLNYQRAGLTHDGGGEGSIIYETVNGVRVPRQMISSRAVFDITDTPDGKGYQIAQYWLDELPAPGSNGIRAIPADLPAVTRTIFRNPDGSATTTSGKLDVLHMTRHPQSGVEVIRAVRLTYPVGTDSWTRAYYAADPASPDAPAPYQVVQIARTPHLDGTETVEETVKDADSSGNLVISAHTTTTYAFYKYGFPVEVSKTTHTGTGSDLTTSHTYYTNRSEQASFNKPATLRRSDGQWANYTYTGNTVTGVVVTKTVSGWLDNPAPAVGAPADENANKVVTEIEAYNETGTFGREEKVQGVLVSKTWGERYKDNAGQLVEKARVETGSATLLTLRTGYPDDQATAEAERGRLKSVEYSDGTVELRRYQLQGGNRVETIDKGAGTLAGVTSGTRTVNTYSSRDILIKEIVSDLASGVELSAREAIMFDSSGQPTRWAYDHNPDDYSETLYGCCGIDSERTRDGVVTTYTRDALKRPLTAVNNGVTLTYTYGSRVIGGTTFPSTNVTATAGSLSLDKGTTVHDHAGHEMRRISPDLDGDGTEEITTTVHDCAARTTTVTNPDGGTIVTTDFADGQSKSTTGTATAPSFHQYATHAEQGGGAVSATGPTANGPWTRTYENLAGRVLKTSFAEGTSETVLQTNGYDALGRVVSTTDADGVTQLLAYNAEGEAYRQAIDLNQNGQIDSADRVTDTLEDVVADSPVGPAVRTRSIIYDLANNPATVSTTYQSVDGLASRQESLGVATPAVSARASHLDRADGSWTDTVTNPDGTKSVTQYSNWLAVSTASLDTANVPLKGATTAYDALRRPTVRTDSRTGAVTTAYATNGQISSLDDHGRITAFAYDAMGRRVSTTLPDNSVTHTSYWPTGAEKAAWGSQTNPTVKLYDAEGRLHKLRTFRSANLGLTPDETTPGSDETTWTYNGRGLLTRKQYADGNGTDYAYTSGGRLLTRTWARGITTTYGYNTAGELASTDYSDATPDVTITYDKLGRQSGVIQANQSRIDYTYDPATLALDTETVAYDLDHDGTADFTRVLDRSRDTLGRDTGWQLKNGTTVENQVGYQYGTTDGRLTSVSGGAFQVPSLFQYSYLPNSSLIASVTGPAHTVTNTWAADRDVLTLKENKVGTTVVSAYGYTVNSLGQRMNVSQTGTAFASNRNVAWGYDSLGQVISADSSEAGHDRAYEYDAIGNRKKSADSLTLPGTDNYTSNALNQYSSLQLNPQSAIANPQYDADGNATAYPLPVAPTANSALAWDAENRLISTTVNGASTSYLYDSQSRRIAKITGNVAELTIYDAWNPIADYTRSAGVPAVLSQSYTWGTDLSGSLQGAGGVGGLLSVSTPITTNPLTFNSSFPTYDGNGNVSEYLGSNGTISAHFEYDAFGRIVVASGSASDFRVRFSTKKEDAETGLNYYGYRYYASLIGGWMSRDPIQEEGGLRMHGFGKNDGINFVDYLGFKLAKVEVGSVKIDPVDQDLGVDGKTTKTWQALLVAKAGINVGWLDMELVGALEISAIYSTKTGDPEYTKNHEKEHVRIWTHYWNMLVDEVSWTETEWCKPCDGLAASYVAATSSYREAQSRMENNEFDLKEYTARKLANHHIVAIQNKLAENTKLRDEAKIAYDKAVEAFKQKCSSGMNE